MGKGMYNNLPILALILISMNIPKLMAQPLIGLNEGALFIEGSLAVNYQLIDFNNSYHRISLNSDIGGGFLVVDNLALGIKLPVTWTFLPRGERDIGISFLGTYFFNSKSLLVPYFGLFIAPHYTIRAREFLLNAGFGSGILVSMSESVALDIGMAPKLYFPMSDKQKWKLEIPAGFIGVRVFF